MKLIHKFHKQNNTFLSVEYLKKQWGVSWLVFGRKSLIGEVKKALDPQSCKSYNSHVVKTRKQNWRGRQENKIQREEMGLQQIFIMKLL